MQTGGLEGMQALDHPLMWLYTRTFRIEAMKLPGYGFCMLCTAFGALLMLNRREGGES